MRWVHVHISGMVQGVGFRPFVFKLAHELQLKGWVRNDIDGVHIEAGGEASQTELFLTRLRMEAPVESHITAFACREIDPLQVQDFQIVESNPLGKPDMVITPDLGLCDDCRKEITSLENRRFQYPFTTCTHCGPRYSILRSLPYDRHTTAMEEFEMCLPCTREYHDPLNRRHFSQTNSCPDCTVPLQLLDKRGKIISRNWNECQQRLLSYLASGKIVAVKGIGGYLLITDATNPEAIQTLRDRKHRPTKPFALMYPNVESLREDAIISGPEEKAITSIQSPIVLLKAKKNQGSGICLNKIAPGLEQIGAMLPYTAMFELLLKAWGKPVVATSGNVNGSPIIYEDQHAFEELMEIADAIVIHDRSIEISQDDSVLRFTNNNRLMIRRSRGFAPAFLNPNVEPTQECILAMGADLKSAFALQAHGRVYISQYLGDLESYESQQYYQRAIHHMMDLLRIRPQRILVDAHPGYFSSELGNQLATRWGIPVEKIFHHPAHAWSVLAENKLLDSQESVLCVVWDGTGFGEDGQIWGGEFFQYQQHKLYRVAHLHYFPVTPGDLMAREPRLSALSACHLLKDERDAILRKKFSNTEWGYYQKWFQSKSKLKTSSMGRLFDAVASLLEIVDYNSYEGEAAMHLETVAANGHCLSRYEVAWEGDELSVANLMQQVLTDRESGIPREQIAFKFHAWLADAIFDIASRLAIQKIALSGGVFQNRLLVELIEERLQDQAQLYFPVELSANDEGICLGQMAWAAWNQSHYQIEMEENLITA